MAAVADLLAKYNIKLGSTAAGKYSVTCPQCSSKRSKSHLKCLGVLIEGDGRVCWRCNHCGWTGPEKGSGERGDGESGKLQTHDYRDADGVLQFQKVRNPPGSAARFYCRRPDGNGRWVNSLKGIDHKPLYRWPEIVKAMEQGREIAIVEGEKDADNVWACGIPATCNFDGAADVLKNPKVKPKWKPEYSEQLRGARLIVFNDNDPQGYAHGEHVCRASLNIAACVRALTITNYGNADSIITNPPYTRPLMHALIEHFARIGPTWLLLESDWAYTKQASPFLPCCSDIVSIGRLRWIAGTTMSSKDNFAWYRFDSSHLAGPIFHPHGSVSASSQARLCAQCGKPYRPQRSDSKVCSDACRQRAYRERLSVTQV